MKAGPYIEHLFGTDVEKLYSSHRLWVTCAVHYSIPWPQKDVAVIYNNEQYFLRGLKDSSDKPQPACISVRVKSEKDLNSLLKKIHEFTSILGWFEQGYVDITGHMLSSYPIRYSEGQQCSGAVMAGGPIGFNCNYMPIIEEENTRIALAFWREGLKLKSIHNGYSFLSFYKVIESQFTKSNDKVNWINTALPTLEGKALDRIKELEKEGSDVSKHIFSSGRCAVAHATFGKDIIDPDIIEDKIQINQDLEIIMALAKKFIAEELEVPNAQEVLKFRDALEPLYEYLDDEYVISLKAGKLIPKGQVGLNGIEVSISHWPHKPFKGLENLTLEVQSVNNGLLHVYAINAEKDLYLSFKFNFLNGKAHTSLKSNVCLPYNRGGRPNSEIAYLKYQKSILENGIIELHLPNGMRITCEVVIPVNIDVGRTFSAIDQRINYLEGI